MRCGSKPLLSWSPNGLAPQSFPFPWPQGMVTPSKLTEGRMQDLTVGAFPSHHQQPQPSPPCSAECQPSPSRFCAMNHPEPSSTRAAKSLCLPPSCSRCALSPRPPFLNKMTQLLPGPVALFATPTQSFETPQWGSRRVPSALLRDFLADLGEELGHCRAACAVLDPVHLKLKAGGK